MNKQTFIKNYTSRLSPLPIGVVPLKYLNSTGVQWIDTGITPVIGKRLTWTGYAAYKGTCPFGCTNFVIIGNGSLYTRIFYTSGSNHAYTNIVSFKYDRVVAFITDDAGNDISVRVGTSQADGSLWLFGRSDTSAKNKAKCTGFTFDDTMSMTPALYPAGTPYIDGNTLQTVTPLSDKPGMYDTVSGHFFVNQGTGDDFLYELA